MHELTLTEKILKIVLDEAETHGAQQVNKIRIIIGDLSGVVEDSVEFYFRLIAANTAAAGAELDFIRKKTRLFCGNCNREFEKQSGDFLCPECGNLGRLTGYLQECYVDSIEVD